ncbi:M48 family metalloprotease [Spiribacter halobius]|uniref:Peptidase M48 n=1 Tax=Sediminicurvatus halobius TaxID=2182432 RepID=A0A2U2N8H5_9GAMM|nr:M48 family metalloprotease [Spiribacter halobius]PWG65373.1 peptidase M48 [Spiribacter halobius]UEX76389.1 M48 family metalloprotease [Spiribacter halobius]
MDFFGRQDRARRQTLWLLALFGLAVLLIIGVVSVAAVLVAGIVHPPPAGGWLAALNAQRDVIAWAAALTGGGILAASLWRMHRLRRGGGTVAWELGAEAVDPDTRDPLRRRLVNVTEEMALAAGIPVPGVYVLENEQSINAFAAGHGPADAIIAVTRGALERLTRSELQGVVAHEVAHIVHGDTRLNLRLMGWLFGITRVARLGVFLLRPGSRRRRYGGRSHPAMLAMGLVLVAVGYLGLFLARCLKAGVARQREFLADAGAVQFTRLPDGLAGALKKIAAPGANRLRADSEEVAHMLFAAGRGGRLLASHPPIVERIRALEPGFDPAALAAPPPADRQSEATAPGPGERSGAGAAGIGTSAATTDADAAETPAADALAPVLDLLPTPLLEAAHKPEWVAPLLGYLLLGQGADLQAAQLLAVQRHLGAEAEANVRYLLTAVPALAPDLRLPLLDLAFPLLRRAPPARRTALLALADELARGQGGAEVLPYAVARLLGERLREAEGHGRRAVVPGAGRLRALRQVLAVVAQQGAEPPEAARAAYAAGLAAAGLPPSPMPEAGELWQPLLESALRRLDGLPPRGKRRVLEGLEATARHDRTRARISHRFAERGGGDGGQDKARESSGAQAYSTVRRAPEPSATPDCPADPRPQPRIGEICGLNAREQALMRVIAARLHIPIPYL